jgi:hypothetical protein
LLTETALQSVVKPEVHEAVMDELHGIVVISSPEHVFAISSTALKNGKSSFMMAGMQKQPDAAQRSAVPVLPPPSDLS